MAFSSISAKDLAKGIGIFNITQCSNKIAGTAAGDFNSTLYNSACFGGDSECLKDQKLDAGKVCSGAPTTEVFLS
jgi:hypothetical protein